MTSMTEPLSACPSCTTINAPMGTLGRRLHYRCRACGQQWSVTPSDDIDPTEIPLGDEEQQ